MWSIELMYGFNICHCISTFFGLLKMFKYPSINVNAMLAFQSHSYSVSCLSVKSKILTINVHAFSLVLMNREQKQNSTNPTSMLDNKSRFILKQLCNSVWLYRNTLMACMNMLAKYPLYEVAYNTMIFCCLVRQANDSPINNYSRKGNDTSYN